MTPHIEKTVFISYRRTNFWTALAVFKELNSNRYDVFFDYESIPSGDFEKAIIENVKSRAHFIVILSPSALERCHEPGDWLRREIETAIDNNRNIIPLMMDEFDFGSTATTKALTGKLALLKKYNAMGISTEYFEASMAKLQSKRFLDRPLKSVSHPKRLSNITKRITKEQKSAAIKAAPVKRERLSAQEWFEKAYKETNLDEKIRLYTKAIVLNPENASAFNNRGVVYMDKNELDKAIKDFRKAILLEPKDATYYNNRGIGFYKKNELDKAIKDYTKAIRINRKNASYFNNRGNAHKVKKDLDKAITDYNEAIRLKPKNALYLNNRANAFVAKKDLSKAIDDFTKAIQLDSKNAFYFNNRANAYVTKKDFNKAIDDFTKAIQFDPKNASYFNNRGLAFKSKKNLLKAINDFNKAIHYDLNYSFAYHNRGDALKAKGDLDGAIDSYSRAIRLDPSDVATYFNRALTWESKKEYESAIADYQKYLNLGGGRKYRDYKKVGIFIQDLQKKVKRK